MFDGQPNITSAAVNSVSTPSVPSPMTLPMSSSSNELVAGSSPLTPTASINTVIQYPAPIPSFSIPVRDVLRRGDKKQLMLIYSDIISEAATFYMQLLPSDTGKAKVSYENIGRSCVEAFPVLAVADSKTSWTYFNTKLSSAIRNTRCRLKRKLWSAPVDSAMQKKAKTKFSMCAVVKTMLSDKDYSEKKNLMAKELLKTTVDEEHVKLLLTATYINRREWIKNASSEELRLKEVLLQFPAFSKTEFILHELWIILEGENRLDNFCGKMILYDHCNYFS